MYELADGWIFADGPGDLSGELASMTVARGISTLAARGIPAAPVQSLRNLVERHRAQPTKTVRLEERERDGWVTECFAPSWYAFDGDPRPRPPAAARIGSDAVSILAELGYGAGDVESLIDAGVVGPTEWVR